MQWVPRDDAAYDAMLRRSTMKSDVPSKEVLRQLMASMHFDDRCGGYVTFRGFQPLALRKGCRLIDDGPVVDLHELEDIEEFTA
eukprot:1510918-Pyramimonas_sp.AAC.1